MMPPYRAVLDKLRNGFPQPVSNPVHDAYMVFSILRALEQVDRLKSDCPILGRPVDPDWDAARRQRLEEATRTLEEVIPQLVSYLEGMFLWGHPGCQVHVVAPPSIASIIGVLLPAVYNPNLCSEETSRRVAEAEVRSAAMAADLVGYAAEAAAGVFTFGGTGAMLYGVKAGLEKALPGCLQHGVRGEPVVLASDESHACVLGVAGWLGIGQDRVVRVATHPDNSVRVDLLEQAAREVLASGGSIAAIVATLGTTDAFGLDDLPALHAVRERLVEEFALPYRPHLHADAAIGWAWSVFRDYDFEENALGFRGRRPTIASGICRWPTRSAWTFTRPGSRPIRRRWCCSAIVPTCSGWRGPALRCPTCSRPGTITRACSLWKPRGAAPVRWRRWPTCCCWASRGCGYCWGTRWRWPRCCARRSSRTPA